MAWPPCPTLPTHPISSRATFFSQIKKVLGEKWFADMEEMKPKTAEALKGTKIKEFKNCFEPWGKKKKHLDRCIASKGEDSEGD